MLDRVKMLSQLQIVSDKLFKDLSAEYSLARESFDRIIQDQQFHTKIQKIVSPWLIPAWNGSLNAIIPISSDLKSYTVLGTDGSQIYPDRHQGTGCFLVNIGEVILTYGTTSSVQLQTQPFIFTGEDDGDAEQKFEISTDLVNAKRQALEFELGLAKAQTIIEKNPNTPFVFLFDGSLIFWHLESKESDFKQHYLHCYINSLQQLYEKRIACAGYISMPKNKELVSLLRIELCNFVVTGCTVYKAIDHLIDTSIAGFFLTPGTRSIIFKSTAPICSAYPAHLAPHFFYMHVGDEIVRVEIPTWVAEDESVLARVCAIILDQAHKGQGYPVALAEAHEQAVVKGPDREFFYQVITKFAIEQRQNLARSQKSLKKRGLGI